MSQQQIMNQDEEAFEESDEILFTRRVGGKDPIVRAATINKLIERLTHQSHPGTCVFFFLGDQVLSCFLFLLLQ